MYELQTMDSPSISPTPKPSPYDSKAYKFSDFETAFKDKLPASLLNYLKEVSDNYSCSLEITNGVLTNLDCHFSRYDNEIRVRIVNTFNIVSNIDKMLG